MSEVVTVRKWFRMNRTKAQVANNELSVVLALGESIDAREEAQRAADDYDRLQLARAIVYQVSQGTDEQAQCLQDDLRTLLNHRAEIIKAGQAAAELAARRLAVILGALPSQVGLIDRFRIEDIQIGMAVARHDQGRIFEGPAEK